MTIKQGTRNTSYGSTWLPAFLAGILMAFLYIILGYVSGPLHSRGTEALIALVVPFAIAFPIGWKSDSPDVACIGLSAGFVAPCLLWFILSHAGEDLGPAIGALLMSLIIVPGAVFGIGCATLIKGIQNDGITWPSPRGYVVLAIMILGAFVVGRLNLDFREPQKLFPIVVTQHQVDIASVVPPSGSSSLRKQESAKHYLRGIRAFQKQEYKTAAKEWRTAVKLDPDNADARRGLERLGLLDVH